MDAVTDLEPEHSSQRSESPECLGDATVHNVVGSSFRDPVH